MFYNNRNEIDLKYKWKLEDIFSSDKAWDTEFNALNKDCEKINTFKGKLKTKETILKCLKKRDEIDKRIYKVYAYAYMRYCENAKEAKYQQAYAKAGTLATKISSICSFIRPELSKLNEKTLNSIIKDKKFSDYDYMLSIVLKGKKHTLTESEEKIFASASNVVRGFHDAFEVLDSSELDFGSILVRGKQTPLSHGTYSVLLQDSDQRVRRAAFETYYKPFIKQINTIGTIYASNVKATWWEAQARGFKSSLDQALFYEDVNSKVYKNLIDSVNSSFKPLHEYVALRKEILGLKQLNMYDMYVPIVANAELSLDFEEAKKVVLEGLKPLGNDYIDLLKGAMQNRWIDVYENAGKRSGAFSYGVPGVHPFILLNYQKTTHDVFTLAHELGHSIHSYYSSKEQPYAKSDYTIFVAEVASTVNEMLLIKYLLNKETDTNIRKFLLSYYLDSIRTTMYRQTMFAEFEQITHDIVEKGEPLTSERMCDEYYALNKKYYGPAVEHNNEIRYEWARIPHFYNDFYVYKYATGITSAVVISELILRDGESAVKKYKKFLASGSSTDPVSELKIAGVDLTSKEPFEILAKSFKETLKELKKLV